MGPNLLTGFAVTLTGAVIEWLWIKYLCSRKASKIFLDIPNARSSHTQAVPRSAGAPFALVFCLVSFWTLELSAAVTLFFAYVVLALTGILDDMRGIAARVRFPIQVAISTALLVSFLKSSSFSFTNYSSMDLIAASLLWIFFSAGSINVFNFADGINGFVGLTGLLSLNYLLLYRASSFEPFQNATALGVLGLSGALAVFLYFNLFRKRVFMGDGGSTVLGLVNAQLSLCFLEKISQQSPATATSSVFIAILCAISFAVWIFADCGTMIVVKIIKHVPFAMPHRHHSYQRLSRRSTHAQTSLLIFAFQLCVMVIFDILAVRYLESQQLTTFTFCLAALLLVVAAVFFRPNLRSMGEFLRTEKS